MNGEQLLSMGRLMLSQARLEDAERLLGQAVSEMPQNGEAKALLALVISVNRDRLVEATQLANQAIADDPEDSLGFRVLSSILLKCNRTQQALEASQQAIELAPYEVANFGCKCQCLINLQRWSDALEAAETGLRLAPEDETCSSIRLLALERLGRVDDALEEGERFVRNSPDSSDAHASKGWALSNNGDYRAAQESFREALRLDPSNEFARVGMANSIKQTNFLFRWLHKFSVLLTRFSGKQQMFILIGIWVAMMGIPRLARQIPALQPYSTPLTFLFFVLVLGTWILPILANTVLRFHSFGRYLLSYRENVASVWMAVVLGSGVVLAVAQYAVFGELVFTMLILMFTLYMAVPLKLTMDANEGLASQLCYVIAGVFSLYFLALAVLPLLGELGCILMLLITPGYIYGILIYSFVGGVVANLQPRV